MSKINTNPDHLRRSGNKLTEFGDKISQGGQKMETAGQNLVSHASGDRSGFGAVISKAMGRGMEVAGKVFQEGGRVAGTAGKHLGKTGDLHEGADLHGKSELLKHDKTAKNPHVTGSSGGGGKRGGGKAAGGGKDKQPPKLPTGGGGGGRAPKTAPASGKNRPINAGEKSLPGEKKKCLTDPVDVATGDVVMTQRDLTLPGPLALLLERTHVSSYRAGRWFGPSWASTVDQRVEVDQQGVCYFAPDGMILVYPHPAAGEDVLPLVGPRWPLSTDTGDGDYRITVTGTGRELHFSGHPHPDTGVVPLRAIADGDGNRIEVDYDQGGVPTGLRHSAGYQVGLRTEHDRITELHVLGTGPDGPLDVLVLRYGYDDNGRLTELVNSTARATHFDYDAEGRMTGWQDRNGTWYRYVYDSNGRCTRTVGAEGYFDAIFSHDEASRTTTYTDAVGQVSSYEFSPAGDTVRETDPLGNTTSFEWDAHHQLLSRTDPLGRTTRFEYGEDTELSAVIRPDDSRVALARDPDGALTIEVEARGRRWLRTYEPGTAPDPFTMPIGVGGKAELDSSATPAGPGESGTAESGPRGDGTPEAAAVDLFGRPRTITDAFGRQTQFGWTVEGKLSWQAGPDGRQQWAYDGEGNELAHHGVLGQVRRREYGAFDLLTATVDEFGARTTYRYDNELRLTEVTGPHGRTWQYSHDPAGRLVREVDFGGRVRQYEYDAAGQLVRTVNAAGEAVEYSYDVLGAAVERSTPTGSTRYTYDPVGRLAAAVSEDAELTVVRDDDGRVVTHTVNNRTVAFSYDPANRWMRRETPEGVTSHWSYDASGQPVALSTGDHVVQFERDEHGSEVARLVDDTVALRQSFDQDRRLTGQVVSVAEQPVHQRDYDYRPDGHLVGLRDATDGPTGFQLDAAGRVTEVAAPDHTESYRYDLAGDIVLGQEADRYSYDAEGRLVSRWRGTEAWHYTWDALDRMTGVVLPDGTRWGYRYDPLGRRIAKQRLNTDGTVAEQIEFVWDGTVLIEQVHTDPAGTRRVTTWDHDPDENRPLVQLEQDAVDERFYTIVTDLVGTPVQMFDQGGAPAWRSRSRLWGSPLPATGNVADTPLRFPGQYHDAETGLHYNVYRYYDPATGRYVSQDPLGLEPAPNPMAYVGTPLTARDPLGLMPDDGCGSTSGSKKRPRPADDDGNAAGTSSSKKPKTGKNFKPGDTVNNDLKSPAVDNHKVVTADPDATTKQKKNSSEQLGEAGALDYLHKTTGNDKTTLHTATEQNPLQAGKYGLEKDKPWPHAVAFNGANVSDVAHWDGKTLHVVEAKGGSSQLTGGDVDGRVQKYDHTTGELRPYKDRVDDPMRMDQGSDRYLTDVAHSMTHSKKEDGRNEIGQSILDGQKQGVVKYVPVGTAINDGKAVVKVKHGYGE